MANQPLHGKQIIANGIHTAIAYEYADSVTRLAATGFTVEDRNKLARDLDTNSIFILLDPSGPTWGSFGGGVSDHGGLTGLADDDHTQYLLADGSRSLSGSLNVFGDGYISGDFEISGKLTVDGLIDPVGLVFTEQVTSPYSPTATEGMIWLRDDGYLMFTDQNDNPFIVSGNGVGSGGGGGVTDHGALTGLSDDDHTQYLLADGSRTMSGNLDIGSNNIITSGTVDGRDVSVDGAALDSHISNTSNPHSTSIVNIGSGTLAQLNSVITDENVVPTSITITAGTGLTGGGDLSTNRTLNVIAHADGSIIVNSDDIQIGVLASDIQHGQRGGNDLHNLATSSFHGFLSSDGYSKLDGIEDGAEVNTIDSVFGRDGIVTAEANDYDSDQITNVSSISGAFVSDALETLNGLIVGGGAGTVSGPPTTIDNAIVRWSGIDGYTIQNSGIIIDDSNNITGVVTINSVTIESHSSRHESGGADEINVTDLSGLLADAQTPIAHASSHESGGGDEIDGYNIALIYTPINYNTPINNIIGEYFYQIDEALASIGGGSGDVSGPGSSTNNAIVLWDGTGGDTIKNSVVTIDGSGNIITSGTVDGRDVSVDGAALDSHISNTSNPHSTDIGNLGSGTLAELNTAVTDATLDDASDPRDPNSHAASHESGGADEIDVTDLSGLLADGQTPLAHASSHESGGSDVIDGYQLDLIYTPINYTAPNNNLIGEHIAAIDDALALGGVDNNAIHDNVSGEIAAITEKIIPISSDLLLIEDSADANSKKRIQIGSLPGGGASNHGSLNGLDNDDHEQYLLVNGTRSMGGNLDLDGYHLDSVSTASYDSWPSLIPSDGYVTVEFDLYQGATVTLDDTTITTTLQTPRGPGAFKLLIMQDGYGGREINWETEGSEVINAPNGAITIASGSEEVSLVGLIYNGIDWYVVSSQPMSEVT